MIDICELSPGYIRAIAPYPPGKPISELAREMGLDEQDIVKLASNENSLGPSPLALKAMSGLMGDLARYPDGSGFDLKAAISSKLGVARDQIVLGNGSNDVLELAARAFLSLGTSAVYAQHAFAVYPLATQAAGGIGITVPAINFAHDLEAMAAAIRDDTRIVFVANPNNPTGTLLGEKELLAFLKKAPSRVLVVLDEAYGEYLPDNVKLDSVSWLRQFPNLVITRTFSKAYGLAGLRVGYALAHAEVADLMNRVRQPFNLNSLAQAAATAALNDTDFLKRSFELNKEGMARITGGLNKLGLSFIPSYGNFVSFRIGSATAMYQRLLKRGVIVRPVGNYGMPEYLRVSIGLESENEKFLTALQDAMKE
jgi:histidinol-phosphate aminotransferase